MTGSNDDALWFDDLVQRLRVARRGDDQSELQRLLAWAAAEGSVGLADAARAILAAEVHLDDPTAAPAVVDFVGDGQPRCDFCLDGSPVAYYEVAEFTTEQVLEPGGGTSPLGAAATGTVVHHAYDGFWYTCGTCRGLVDSGQWAALRRWCGPRSTTMAARTAWLGFQRHRRGGAVDLAR